MNCVSTWALSKIPLLAESCVETQFIAPLREGVISYIFMCKLIKINITANIRILIENVLLERKKNVHLPLFRR